MVVKGVDDKSYIVKALSTLLNHPKIYPYKKEQIKTTIQNLKKGWSNEKSASYYIDSYYKDRDDVWVIHDLRITTPTERVQIDHLIVYRFEVSILESKYFSSHLFYDPQNREFFIKTRNGKKLAIPNPIKQAERQELALKRILKDKGLDRYFPSNFSHYVLVSPRVKLEGKMPERIVKADSFVDKFREEDRRMGIGTILKRGFNLITHPSKGLEEGVKKLVSLHRPYRVEHFLNQLNLEWTSDWLKEQLEKLAK
jgi:hypothetical protein